MSFFQFVFQFLYARDWHTGKLELSRPRVALFSAAVSLIVLGLIIVTILQSPVEFSQTSST